MSIIIAPPCMKCGGSGQHVSASFFSFGETVTCECSVVQEPPLTINELSREATDIARDKGFQSVVRGNVGAYLMLIVSELSEALEELRAGNEMSETYVSCGDKPEGVPIELADAVIRICNLCGEWDINLEEAIRTKMAYNRTRPHMHGKKF